MGQYQGSSRKYAKISINRRSQLITQVIEQNKPVAQVAKRLNIKLSTAKHIIKTYAEKGYLYNKKMRKNQNSLPEPSHALIKSSSQENQKNNQQISAVQISDKPNNKKKTQTQDKPDISRGVQNQLYTVESPFMYLPNLNFFYYLWLRSQF